MTHFAHGHHHICWFARAPVCLDEAVTSGSLAEKEENQKEDQSEGWIDAEGLMNRVV